MKYCSKCGAEMADDAKFCPKCGAASDGQSEAKPLEPANNSGSGIKKRDETIVMIAFVFMVISTVLTALAIIPLAWMIPMTISVYSSMKNKQPISVALKVCTLIFVSLIAGILLLVGDDSDY